MKIPVCLACNDPMERTRQTIRQTKNGARLYYEWRCTNNHKARYHYTRGIPGRYRVEYLTWWVSGRSRLGKDKWIALYSVDTIAEARACAASYQFKSVRVRDNWKGEYIRMEAI